MKINGIDLPDIDFMDADISERFENVILKVSDDMKSISPDIRRSEGIRAICQSIFDCFNCIFGNGTDKKLFGDKCNLNICISAFAELAKAEKDADEAFNNANILGKK